MTDPNEQVVSEALCRNQLSGSAEVCASICGDCTVPGQPHPCEHALAVWGSDAQEISRALLAGEGPVRSSGEGNNATAAAVPRPSTAEATLREALERIRREPDTDECCGHFQSGNHPEDEPQCCGSPVGNHYSIATSALAEADASGEKAGITQAARSDASPSSSPSPAVRDGSDERDAFEVWAQADNRRLEGEEFEERVPGNNLYYQDDTTNHAYVGWCAARAVRDVTLREKKSHYCLECSRQWFDEDNTCTDKHCPFKLSPLSPPEGGKP